MPLHENSVILEGGIVVWEGVKNPEVKTGANNEPFSKYGLKIVLPPNSRDLPLLDQLAQQCLQNCQFKGRLPAGAHWIMKQVGPGEFNDLFPGWWCVNGITYRAPQVYDESGNLLQPMQYGPLLYTGQRVDLLVSPKDYNEQSKGIKAQLEGVRIIVSANAQPVQLGGGANAAAAFGGAPHGGFNPPAQPQPAYSPPAQPQPAYSPNQGYNPNAHGGFAPQGQPAYAPPEAGYTGGGPQGGYNPQAQPPHGNPPQGAQYAGPTATQPPSASTATYPSSNQVPQQANNFLPPRQ